MQRVFALAWLVVGCTRHEPSPPPPTPHPLPTPQGSSIVPVRATIDVAAINALVPTELVGELVFEERELVHEGIEVFTIAAPKEWVRQRPFSKLTPDLSKSDEIYFGVESDCAGVCGPSRDWAAISNQKLFAPMATVSNLTIMEDDKQPNRRTMVFDGNHDDRYVVVAWWDGGASWYFACGAKLRGRLKLASTAFKKACGSVRQVQKS
jgi:hypothetical protein